MTKDTQAPVAYILKRYPRLTETFILNEIRAMERLGTRLHIFSLLPPEPPPHHPMVREVQAPVHTLPVGLAAKTTTVLRAHARVFLTAPLRYARAFATVTRWSLTSSKPLSVWRQFVRAGVIVDVCRANGVRHIHAHFANAPTTVAHVAHLLSGIPFSFTAHAKDIYLSRPEVIERHLKAAEFTATCTGYNASHLRRLAPSLDPRKIRLIYHGIDLDSFTAGAGAASTTVAAATPGRPLILSVGRLVPKKGHEDLIAACALLRDAEIPFRCMIVGGGPLQETIAEEIRRNDLESEVSLRGAMTHKDLIGLYRQARLFVLAPRIAEDGDRDGIPNVITEAMAVGVPVIATDISGIPEVVRHERTGLLAPSRDPAAIAAAMQRLLGDPALARRLADNARALLWRDFNLWDTTRALRELISGTDDGSLAPSAGFEHDACCAEAHK